MCSLMLSEEDYLRFVPSTRGQKRLTEGRVQTVRPRTLAPRYCRPLAVSREVSPLDQAACQVTQYMPYGVTEPMNDRCIARIKDLDFFLTLELGAGMGRGLLLWLLGVPIPIILLLALCSHH